MHTTRITVLGPKPQNLSEIKTENASVTAFAVKKIDYKVCDLIHVSYDSGKIDLSIFYKAYNRWTRKPSINPISGDLNNVQRLKEEFRMFKETIM